MPASTINRDRAPRVHIPPAFPMVPRARRFFLFRVPVRVLPPLLVLFFAAQRPLLSYDSRYTGNSKHFLMFLQRATNELAAF